MATPLMLDREMILRIEALAGRRDRSSDWIMREAIREYVEREEARWSFREEALQSWDDFRSDGLHLTGEEVDNWLRGWGKPGETDMPKSHD